MSSNIPFVTIVIPTHNRRNLLKAAVESLFKQSYPKDHYEIIVVDNASVDGTGELMISLHKNAPCELKYFRKEDEGPGISRNVGIKAARGSIVAFTDDDCEADRHWIENGVLQISNGVGLVQGRTIPKPHQNVAGFVRTMEITRENGMYQTCNMFYRKDVLDLVDGFSSDFIGLHRFGKPMLVGDDVDLACRVKRLGWESAFAKDAVIYHAVLPFNPWRRIFSVLTFQTFYYALPKLIKKYPELRKSILFHRFFFSKTQALFDLFITAVFCGLAFHNFFFLFTVPFLIFLAKSNFSGQPLRKYPSRFVFASAVFVAHVVICILLIAGNIRHGTLVL